MERFALLGSGEVLMIMHKLCQNKRPPTEVEGLCMLCYAPLRSAWLRYAVLCCALLSFSASPLHDDLSRPLVGLQGGDDLLPICYASLRFALHCSA